tara:strand:- start:703 stop:1677 length:975 start_codon:yes stop_codon:yes gene_type:complete
MSKKVLITGITGQDGLFLTSELLKRDDYTILGTSRSSDTNNFLTKLIKLDTSTENFKNIDIKKCNLMNIVEVEQLVENFQPDFVYNLIGPGSVSESLSRPYESSTSITTSFNNLINGLVNQKLFPSFFQTSSSEMFKDNGLKPLDENTKFEPKTPYAVSKLFCHNLSIYFREKYNWNISCGILFNHESQFRDDNYLITKIIKDAVKISKGEKKELVIGSLDIVRDWGYTGDVVKAMQLVCENNTFTDYVIGTGVGNSIKDMVKIIFDYLGLNYEEYIKIDADLLRKREPKTIISNPKKIERDLGWKSETSFEQTILKSVKYHLN